MAASRPPGLGFATRPLLASAEDSLYIALAVSMARICSSTACVKSIGSREVNSTVIRPLSRVPPQRRRARGAGETGGSHLGRGRNRREREAHLQRIWTALRLRPTHGQYTEQHSTESRGPARPRPRQTACWRATHTRRRADRRGAAATHHDVQPKLVEACNHSLGDADVTDVVLHPLCGALRGRCVPLRGDGGARSRDGVRSGLLVQVRRNGAGTSKAAHLDTTRRLSARCGGTARTGKYSKGGGGSLRPESASHQADPDDLVHAPERKVAECHLRNAKRVARQRLSAGDKAAGCAINHPFCDVTTSVRARAARRTSWALSLMQTVEVRQSGPVAHPERIRVLLKVQLPRGGELLGRDLGQSAARRKGRGVQRESVISWAASDKLLGVVRVLLTASRSGRADRAA